MRNASFAKGAAKWASQSGGMNTSGFPAGRAVPRQAPPLNQGATFAPAPVPANMPAQGLQANL